jgi:hypothetical protein
VIDTAVCDVYGAYVKTAVIILLHGSRTEGSGKAVVRILAEVRQKGGYAIVEDAYLQYASPLPGETFQRCIQQQVKKQHPGIAINVIEVVGSHALMPDVVLDLVRKGDCGARMNRK